jgi:ABC-type Fe3+-hydroxamate transport system substrate-binding protein
MPVPARRVVSLVPSLTETVCDLGVSCRLVGCTRYCVAPEDELMFVPRVGGTKNPDLKKITSLEPDLILVNGEENRREDIDWLRARFEILESLPTTVPEAAAVVKEVGRRLDVEQETEAFLLDIEAQIARAEVVGLCREPVRVFYPIWKQPWIGVNRATYVHDVLVRAGAVNVCASREARYPVVPQDELSELGADLVLLPSEPFAFNSRHREQLLKQRVFGDDVTVLMVDGKNFCWHGTRSGRGLGSVTNLLRPFRRVA